MGEVHKLPTKSGAKSESIAPCEEDALIPPGLYELAYVRHDYRYIFRRWSLDLTFCVVGERRGTILHCYYRVAKENKAYRAGPKSKLMRSARNLFGRSAAKYGMPWDRLKNVIVEGEVVTVTKDSAENDLGEANQYSIIGRLVRVVQ